MLKKVINLFLFLPLALLINPLEVLSKEKKGLVDKAIEDIIEAYNSSKIEDSEKSYTVKWMKKMGIGK